MPVHTNTPFSVPLPLHAPADSVPETTTLASACSCAVARSAAVGATPACCSPPLKATDRAVPAAPVAKQVAFLMAMLVATHAPAPAASAGLAHPVLTVPGPQSVHVLLPATHALLAPKLDA